MTYTLMPQLLLVGKLFLLLGVGVLLRKIGKISENGKKTLSDLVLEVILPCNIVSSFISGASRSLLMRYSQMLIVSVAIQAISFGLSFVLYSFCAKNHQPVLKYATLCSNSGSLGTTVAQEMFGDQGAMMATIYCTPLRIAMWTIGLSFFTKRAGSSTLKKVITNPCILAVIIGVLLTLADVRIPAVLCETIKSIGSCNSAMSMIMVGTLIADCDLRLLLNWEGWYYAVIRLVGMPLLTLLLCRLFGVDELICSIAVVLTAMPMGSTTSILAYKYGADSSFAAAVTASTTVLSLIAVPIWYTIVV